MVNALYDFNLGPVMPYLGGGIGYRFSDRWRMDITGDYMRGLDASIKG